MDFLGSVLFLGAAIWFFLTALSRGERSGRRDMWSQLSNRYRGTVMRSGWFRVPGIRFRHSDTQVVIRQPTRRRPATTDAWFDFPDKALRVHIVSNSTPLTREAVEGLQVVDMPQDTFFWRYRVFTNDVGELNRLLGETVKWQIEQLRQHFPNRGLEVRIADGRLLIRKHFAFRQIHQIERFVSDSLKLYEQLVVSQTAGVEILTSGDAESLEPARCQICGELIKEDLVHCRRCGTPHHRECWEYSGSCSVFACRETHYVDAG